MRAITLRQLRDIQVLLERVCKARLFRCASRSSEELCEVSWHQVNQHHIAATLIKKVIPEDISCSWVELVAERPQKPRIFVSHNWEEPFHDFMRAILHHRSHVGARSRDTYWLCVYALNQWQVDVGTAIEEGPFVSALRHADSAVLMLDKRASALTRLWCLLETYVILKKYNQLLQWDEPKLKILTPMGVLGTWCVSSGPVVQALMSFACSNGGASQPQDRRRILNYIAEVPEQTGTKEMDDNGRYEENLLQGDKKEKFDTFDKLIHNWADKTIRGEKKSSFDELLKDGRRSGCLPKLDASDRGLTLAQLRMMAGRFRKECRSWKRIGRTADKQCAGEAVSPRLQPEKLAEKITLYDFVWEVLKKDTSEELTLSFAEAFTNGTVQEPEYFFGVSYMRTFDDVLAAIEWHAEARELPDTTVYWAWFFSYSLLELTNHFNRRDGTSPSEICWNKEPMIEGCLLIIDPVFLNRPNPLLESYKLMSRFSQVDIACPTGVRAWKIPFPNGGYELGTFDLSIAEALANFDIREVAKDDDTRRAHIDDSQVADFHLAVRLLGSAPCLHQAVGKPGRIEELVRANSQIIGSRQIAGMRGVNPLMIAAAQGEIDSMETLLRLQADPNGKDADGESCLHYAALGGHLEAARLLVHQGALIGNMSNFNEGEIPSRVAAMNPAFWLGIDTEGVFRFLMEEEQLHQRLIPTERRVTVNVAVNAEDLIGNRSSQPRTPLSHLPGTASAALGDWLDDTTDFFLPKAINGVSVLVPLAWRVDGRLFGPDRQGLSCKAKAGSLTEDALIVPQGEEIEGEHAGEGLVQFCKNGHYYYAPESFLVPIRWRACRDLRYRRTKLGDPMVEDVGVKMGDIVEGHEENGGYWVKCCFTMVCRCGRVFSTGSFFCSMCGNSRFDNRKPPMSTERMLVDVFRKYDTLGTGTITADQFRSVIENVCANIRDEGDRIAVKSFLLNAVEFSAEENANAINYLEFLGIVFGD